MAPAQVPLSPAPDGDIPAHIATQLEHLSISAQTQEQDEIAASPLLTVSALGASAEMQYGLIGADSSSLGAGLAPDSPREDRERRLSGRLFQNISAPSSTFICGSQGSGKSNTLACLLENALLPSALGHLPRPLTAIVFHYDGFNSDVGGLPCEAAYLASNSKVKVRVLCAPTNMRTMTDVYRRIPNVTIEPFRLSDRNLNTKRMLDLMAVGESGSIPLYMHVVTRVLRDMRLEQQGSGRPFQYASFKTRMAAADLTPAQWNPLSQRLDTLESFMANSSAKAQPKTVDGHGNGIDWSTKAGQLTIVDLSCPCVTAELACSLFNIALHLFLEGDKTTGRVVALDEAHKYMHDAAGESQSHTLTENLLAVIRLQRHLAVRVIISTQEPTVSPKLLDLCSVTIVHRFSSPDWLRTLQGHLAGLLPMAVLAGDTAPTQEKQDDESHGVRPLCVTEKDVAVRLFGLIVGLRTGQALVFSPSTILRVGKENDGVQGTMVEREHRAVIDRLGHRVLLVDIRTRFTEDGGQSIMAL